MHAEARVGLRNKRTKRTVLNLLGMPELHVVYTERDAMRCDAER